MDCIFRVLECVFEVYSYSFKYVVVFSQVFIILKMSFILFLLQFGKGSNFKRDYIDLEINLRFKIIKMSQYILNVFKK